MIQTEKFIRQLFPVDFLLKSDKFILIWSLGDKRSTWFDDPIQAANFADGKSDTYIGCGLSPENYGENKRCKAKDISGIPGLWIDMDYKNEQHKKDNLPPDYETCINLIKKVAAPTITVNTGNGVQAWWLFNEPWLFSDNADRVKASNLVKIWQEQFRALCEKEKYELDSVHDLSRILRIPGTYNGKNKPKKLVTIDESLSNDNIRFSADSIISIIQENKFVDFNKLFLALPSAPKSESIPKRDSPSQLESGLNNAVSTVAQGIVIRRNQGPPTSKWKALKETDPKIEQTFLHKRQDMRDTSMSAHDMALANYAAGVEWSDQEICDLLVFHRMSHNVNDPKINRIDYFLATINEAKKSINKRNAAELIEEKARLNLDSVKIETEDKKELLNQVSILIGVPIISIKKYKTDPPTYVLETEKGEINLGGVDGLVVQQKFRFSIAATTEFLIDTIKSYTWHSIAQLLLKCCEHIDVSPEATDKGSIDTWLNQYFIEKTLDENAVDAIQSKTPFTKDDKIFFFLSDLVRWLSIVCQEKMKQKQLALLLKNYGATNQVIRVENATVRVWSVLKSKNNNLCDEL